MGSPSILGNLGTPVTVVVPYSTSTARFFVRTSDTGTVAFTGRQIDLSQPLHNGTAGTKPLDATVHGRKNTPRWLSAKVSIPLELVYHTSGLNTYVTVAHQHREATAGAGSTYATIKTEVFRFKMGTDTDAIFHTGLRSDVNLQAVKRYYRANITFAWRTASSTAAKDTTTSQEMVCLGPVIEFGAGNDIPQLSVPFKVS